MKKIICLISVLLLTIGILSACGEKEFDCALCGETFIGKENVVKQDGVVTSLCDDCFELYENLSSFLD